MRKKKITPPEETNESVGLELARLKSLVDNTRVDVYTTKKLVFSSNGELILTDTPERNDVVVDQIYKDGFFNKAA